MASLFSPIRSIGESTRLQRHLETLKLYMNVEKAHVGHIALPRTSATTMMRGREQRVSSLMLFSVIFISC